MFQVLFLLFGWFPSPLDIIFEGAFAIFVVIVLIQFIAKLIDMIPFL